MSKQIGDHIRSNVVGYVAVFLALSGIAYAADAPKNSVTSKSIAAGAVNTQEIRSDAVTESKIAAGAVGSEKIARDAVGAENIAGSAVTTAKIAAGAITADRVGDDVLTGANIAEGSLVGIDAETIGGVAAGALQKRVAGSCGAGSAVSSVTTAGTVDCNSFPTTTAPSGTAGGDLTGTYPSPTLRNNAVGVSKFQTLPTGITAGASFDASNNGTCDPQGNFPNNTPTTVNFTSEVFDTFNAVPSPGANGCYNAVQAPVTGTYVITAAVFWAANATGSRRITVSGGGISYASASQAAASATQETRQSLATIGQLNANETISLEGFQDSGAPLKVMNGSIALSWIGP